ncbi:hypothetical protein L486_02412 [Kwoniella mangroviensis CBS 10435]|uniref:Uncharacterized protein n=1 Tax=Kwoniella mangroviensis CBS 10435 TaxID=1331196 RepID=A0A1B9IW23_9TREE|nr:uncharacterized protein I203_04424 [Kwoniella mangroviensis CBS 8507]OCF59739.1 hypothetical protein L486_02412 [Kwoniella mangroviensis CBS 10435]OCF66099.1 hypothetical protein I203_04424 [Kwoniella mangroviensis CBS 8507]OCF71261.1 hypothetical protein I204_08215 [Kwoniella mangroviensis CBS 8886]
MSTMASPPTAPSQQLLERASSRPSLTHSSSSTVEDSQDSQLQLNQVASSNEDTETLITPIDPPLLQVSIKNGAIPIKIESTIDEALEHPSPVKEVKKGRLNLSKSMQTLRKKKGGEKGRERASSVSEKTTPVPSLPTVSEKAAPPQTKTSAPAPVLARPPMPTKQSSGFSSFLRKLTGRSATTSPAPSDKAIKEDKSATLAKRKTMAFGGSNKPTLSKIDTSKNDKGSVSAISKISQARSEKQMVDSPLPITPVASAVRETDPLKIPLPPSPISEFVPTLPPGAAPPIDFTASPAPTPAKQSTATKKKAEGMLSLEGFEFDEEEDQPEPPNLAPVIDTTTASPKKENTESHDVVKPLAPIKILARTNTNGPVSANSVRSSVLSSSAETKIITPVASSSSPPMPAPQVRKVSPTSSTNPPIGLSPEKIYEGIKFAGSSPPRKAPIGTGSMGDLGRKESKWRKSVMGLSDKSKAPASKRQSAFPPPTSHDAYQAQQARIAKNRQSCAPTLHSSASIAAAARGQMTHMKLSKDEQDMAETFFMS